MKCCDAYQDSHVVDYSKQQISNIQPSNTIPAVISIHYGTTGKHEEILARNKIAIDSCGGAAPLDP